MQRLVIIYNFLCVCVLENFHCEMFKVGGHLETQERLLKIKNTVTEVNISVGFENKVELKEVEQKNAMKD